MKMNIRSRNVLSCLFLRPWLGVPLGIWVALSVVYYWWLISRINVLETQNKVYKAQAQARLSQTAMKQMLVDSGTTYHVPVIPDAMGTLCETIHIALVCMSKCTQQFTPMLKSLLHHRQNPLHFHMIVDGASQQTISKLFDTWDLPDVKYTCYNAQNRLSQVRWIPNSHYSGIYALVKLMFLDILPTTLQQVIVLDSDLTFVCDVAELWTLFRNMTREQVKTNKPTATSNLPSTDKEIPLNSNYTADQTPSNRHQTPSTATEPTAIKLPQQLPNFPQQPPNFPSNHKITKQNFQAIGLVENESNWYLNDEGKRWPALGRGYNTGVMLLDLQKIRTKDWSAIWHEAVIENIVRLKHTMLADQDVFNAVIKNNPSLVYNISCQYNVQMSTLSLAKSCYGEDASNVKIIHWNSPSKYDIKIRDAEYFKSIHQSYVNFDGNLLREKLHRCDRSDAVTYKLNYSDLCVSFRAAQRVKLRTHVYYMDYSYTNVDSFDVTLVLQLSMDRLQFLERLVTYWEGPLSAAIYLSDCEVATLRSFIHDSSDALSVRRNIGYHLVFKQDSVHYPVNYLRNVALDHVNTPYVFLMDADFVPSAGLYEHLRAALRLINPYPMKKCLVVPAFETQRYRASPPRNKQALLLRLSTRHAGGDVGPFRAREWPRGHRPTNYTRWNTADQPYEVEWQSDYEPYLVVHRTVPKYDTRFSGFGWNKVSHSVELRAQGYRAVVLPDAFVVHTPHAPSADISAFRADPHYRICLALLKQEFMDDLKRKYNVTFDEPAKADPIFLGQAKSFVLNQARNDT